MDSNSMEEFEKNFCGKWKMESEENLCEEDRKMMTSVQPALILERKGDAIEQTYKDDNFTFSQVVTFGVPYESKAPGDSPMYHNITTCTFKDGVMHNDVVSQLTGEKKRDFEVDVKIEGGKLVTTDWQKGDPSVKAKRVYVKF
ncbi:hypothetical protein MAR_026951 [Mya arenaria]|uniref:Uncharacterized protein n=1 Tax=Mya arenaria TaxID=6604 RepID=A0ABY7EVN0_MYAAR|nr:hypothetical protein MAR_026951 [Mya arenaria]